MKIYFMGVCGTAMGNAALLARAAGHEVMGADTGVYPPMSTVLADQGISLHEGYDPARLAELAPDLVVIGNAMSRGNPEVEWLLDTRAIRFTSLPAMLNEFVLHHRKNIVIAGTHGKTTTTAIAAFLLRENGGDPGFLIGGVPLDPPTGNHLGTQSAPFVIEGDEYDSAFFDKRSKFVHYAPTIAVINNLEFDHADIFRDLADVQRTFAHFTRIVPRAGWIVLNGDDDNLRALGPMSWTRVLRVGVGENNEVQIVDFKESAEGSQFTLLWRGARWTEVRWQLPGLYNARNAAIAATAAALARSPSSSAVSTTVHQLALPSEIDLEPLARFRGVKRRQEVLISRSDLTVIEDFGHHPTALAETLQSFRARFPRAILTAVFEPRSNTARTKTLQTGFSRALAQADEVYLGAVSRAEKLSADERFDAESVAQHLETQGVHAYAATTNQELLAKLFATARGASGVGVESGADDIGEKSKAPRALERDAPHRVVVFFTNGSFDGIIAKFVVGME